MQFKNYRHFTLFLVLLLAAAVIIFVFTNNSRNIDQTEDAVNQTKELLSQAQIANYLTRDYSTGSSLLQESENQLKNSTQRAQSLVDRLNTDNNLAINAKKALGRLQEFNSYSRCLLEKLQVDQELWKSQTEFFTKQNYTSLSESHTRRIENYTETTTCFSETRAVFALNSTFTDIQRNQVLLEEMSDFAPSYTADEYAINQARVDFFANRNLNALQTQANSVLEKEVEKL